MYSFEENTVLINLPFTKETAIGMCALNVLSIIVNILAIWHTYNKGNLRSSSTSIIVANLACMEILVSIKDLPLIYQVIKGEQWIFQEQWCATYGLPNVIFIIVSVSTLVTITTERFIRYRDLAQPNIMHQSQKPTILGYVIAHTTLSYSLTLLWSKYIFVTRKSFCRVEWPPRNGFSITFASSLVFILPISVLIYNILFKNVAESSEKVTEEATAYEKKAQKQLHVAVGIFLLSWTPYVIESMVSGYIQISPLIGMSTAFIPLFTTSLLPYCFLKFFKFGDTSKSKELTIVVQ